MCIIEEVESNIIVVGSALSACEKAWRWVEALELFRNAFRMTIEVNTVSFNALVSACEKCTQWTRALSLFEDMATHHVERSHVAFALSKLGNVMKGLESSRRFEGNERKSKVS